jgi:malto-oligosyltrehalose trehalohydrolase
MTASALAAHHRTAQHPMPFGAEVQDNGAVRFRLWAPAHAQVSLQLDGKTHHIPMQPATGGWHALLTNSAHAGSYYHFVLPDGTTVPDPASRFQPQDVHGPSEVIDAAAYRWHDADWLGRPWSEAVIYELHVGTFTPGGTFSAALEKLPHLAALGITAIELMPLADFPGLRNWGYDGVLPFAPDSTYGRPEALKALIDAAHAHRLTVLLDVVYNHLGPEGNYLGRYAPQFFTDRHRTPWGGAINFDGEHSATVREFFIHNALYWLDEFHFDGLRLDAAHAIVDDGPRHFLQQLCERVHAQERGRCVHLLLEDEHNRSQWLERDAQARPRLFTAQWNDDVHHVLHAAATGEDAGYYADYRGDTGKLGRALAEGFAFQGELMRYRDTARGEPSAQLPPEAFVAFIQNHDQIGNRAFGERIGMLVSPQAARAVAAVYLLLPQIPMLFMGEEWNAQQPFLFFCDFGGELAASVRTGRRQEFARLAQFQDEALREHIPDPLAESTFNASKLDWSALPAQRATLQWYQDALELRRQHLVPLLDTFGGHSGSYRTIGPAAVLVQWHGAAGARLQLAANLSAAATAGFPPADGAVLLQTGQFDDAGGGGPWAVRWSLEGE